MLIDKSGELLDNTGTSTIFEGVMRHDYLPFGEELLPGMGNGSIRATGNGYPGDNIRQKFDRYERDNETGLDYAQARYYGNIHGRFTSPDAPFADQNESDPLSWNLYAFVRNNPCTNTDPTGRNTCYYRKDGGMIACEGAAGLKTITSGDQGKLIYAPKNGRREEYDLNNINAVTYASTAPNPIAELAFEMNRRGPALQQAIGLAALPYVAGAGIATGGAALGVGGIGFGTTVTTLGLSGGAGAVTEVSTVTVTEEILRAVGGKITGYTRHGLNQAISRDGVGVSTRAILDAVRNPIRIAPQSSGAITYVGDKATVILNQAGKVITTYARNTGGTRISPR